MEGFSQALYIFIIKFSFFYYFGRSSIGLVTKYLRIGISITNNYFPLYINVHSGPAFMKTTLYPESNDAKEVTSAMNSVHQGSCSFYSPYHKLSTWDLANILDKCVDRNMAVCSDRNMAAAYIILCKF